MTVRLLHGDSLEQMADMTAGSIDACVSDPPYGLEFMSVAWDTFNDGRKGGARVPNTWNDHGSKEHPRNAYQAAHVRAKKSRAFEDFSRAWATEALRVVKPGGYLVAFGGTRTYHRLTCAIEDAGFEIRDCLMWLYGSGFPKGKGCLKPGWEPIVLARKPAPAPLLQIDACRIEGAPRTTHADGNRRGTFPHSDDSWGNGHEPVMAGHPTGRWPANVVLSHEPECREVGVRRVKNMGGVPDRDSAKESAPAFTSAGHTSTVHHFEDDGYETVAAWECMPECPVRLLDEQSGIRKSGSGTKHRADGVMAGWRNREGRPPAARTAEYVADPSTGGASRFYFCAKASPSERGAFNDHPTVKPLALMQWLCRLVTPTGGTILDPFMGSGSTLLAADREGFDAIGIDQDPHAVEIARRRFLETSPMSLEAAS